MLIKKIKYIAITLMIFATPLIGAENPFFYTPDNGFSSHSTGAFSSMINPTYADFNLDSMLAYRYFLYQDEGDGNHFFATRILGLSFIYGRYSNVYSSTDETIKSSDANYFNFAKGFSVNNNFGWGFSYSFSDSDQAFSNNYSGWGLGFVIRPLRYLSFGLSFLDLNGEINGENIKRKELYSISVRPYNEKLTFSFEGERRAGMSFKDMTYRYGVDLLVSNNISLQFDATETYEYKLGISIPFFIRSNRSSGFTTDFYGGTKNGGHKYYSGGVSLPAFYDKKGIIVSNDKNYLFIKINRSVREHEQRNFFSRTSRISFYDIVNGIKTAKNDKSIDAIMLQIDRAGLGFAQIQELRAEIKNFKKTGKKVHAVMTVSGNKEYYLASVADKIYYAPFNSFTLSGLAANVYFFKGLMDKVGVKFETIKHGKYKSFNEGYTREHMSPEARENLVTLLEDLNNQFISDITLDRGIKKKQLEDLYNQGVITPKEALELNFIDEIAYPSAVYKNDEDNYNLVNLNSYIRENELNKRWDVKPRIAIIYVEGSIIRGKSAKNFLTDAIGDETYSNMVTRAFKDKNVKAVVIRVSSGGGSAAASDLMWNKLSEMKKKYKKPVVISFGNVAASGGYYVSCTGDKIFASKGTITGSIGVISGKISAKELYAKLGINKDTVKMSKFADIYSESKDLNEEERKVLQKGVEFIYDRFTGKVMEARKIEKLEIPNTAEGRVFTATQAKEKKLVDEYGGLLVALNYAATLAKVDHNYYDVVRLPDETTSLLEIFQSSDVKMLMEYIKPITKRAANLRFANSKGLYLYPYQIEIE